MPEQALYLKWRPQTFDDVIGQDHITRTLRNALEVGAASGTPICSAGRAAPARRPRARLLAKAVNCLDPDIRRTRPATSALHCIAVNEGRFLDLIEIDAASHTGVDDVRDLRDKIAFSPSEGQFKVYIIDEVHRFCGSGLRRAAEDAGRAAGTRDFRAGDDRDRQSAADDQEPLPEFEFRRCAV